MNILRSVLGKVRRLLPRLANLVSGAMDGLSYPFAVVLLGPIVVHFAGTQDYSKVAAVTLMCSIGALFNIVGAQGVIYTLAREDMPAERSFDILSATMLVTACGIALYGAILIPICRFTGIHEIFPTSELLPAGVLSWLLCLAVSVDGVLGGVLKARHLIRATATVELCKSLGVIGALITLSKVGSWILDCACLVCIVTCSFTVKWYLVHRLAHLRFAGWRRALREVKGVTSVNSWQWLMLLAAFFFQQADRLILASRLGAGEFATYNFCWQISSVVQTASAASLMFILPSATASASAGVSASSSDLRSSYKHDVEFGAIIAASLAAVSSFGTAFIFHTSILPEALRGGFSTFMIMSVCMFVSSLSVVPYYYLVALGGLPSIALVNIVGAGLAFITALLTVGPLGMTGLAISKAWSVVTLSCYWFCRTRLNRRDLEERKAAKMRKTEQTGAVG